MSAYNFEIIEDLKTVPNAGVIVERLDAAATRATALLRMLGQSLPKSRELPTKMDVEEHLREMVADAFDVYLSSKCAAINDKEIREVDGFSSDELFEVSLADAEESDGLELEILMRLV